MDDVEYGSRVLYIVVLSRNLAISKLNGDEFLSACVSWSDRRMRIAVTPAWWQIVAIILWKNGVYHCDVNPSNLMAYRTPDGRLVGVYHHLEIVPEAIMSHEPAGAPPFMALDLLTQDVIEGQIKLLYQHATESFVWALIWVCTCYEGGMLNSSARPHRSIPG
ncbi:hypothetical protein DEU56DRAFT_914273 [Suillus clintonianus]|uniref:uncharacterized protein n=1 Tax=Suillus clintonianus TaxID=1904413 RepID=UPI001B863C03|nr:uncharacterized protein DEU56DRAFT_914273 [Suillus clintonianus]KAG2132077.1 hypothetical protein DEU56DRAFT_914273 [Suillus clintonianus]